MEHETWLLVQYKTLLVQYSLTISSPVQSLLSNCLLLQVYVRAAIYHGSEPLCPSVCTARGAVPENAEWNEYVEFDVAIKDIPRAAKLCFVILGATDTAMAKK